MCGRFALHATESEIKAHFQLKCGFPMSPRYNIAPHQPIPAIRSPGKKVDFLNWGFTPSWAAATLDKAPACYINARAESLHEKPAIKHAIKKNRCIIPATGFYEWKVVRGKKQPFFIFLTHQPLFGLAGIWGTWQGTNGQTVESCAIITTPALSPLNHLHERMPLILAPNTYNDWLMGKDKEIAALLNSPHWAFAYHPVTPKMSHPQLDAPICLQSLH